MGKYLSKIWIKKNWLWIALSLILLFAFILRVYSLGSEPMWIDETISSVAAKNIVLKGVPVFDSGIFYGRALVFHYLLAGLISIHQSDFSARFISVIFGCLTVLLAFFVGREFSAKKGEKNNISGLVAALLCAVLFLEVVYSRQARFYQMFQFLFFLSIFLLYKSKENKVYGWLSCISLILLLDTQIEALVLIPFFLYVFIFEQKDWKLSVITLLVAAYFGRAFFGISSGGSSLAQTYAESYTSDLYYRLRAFSLISLIGIPFAYMWNKRLTLLLFLPTIIAISGLLFIKVIAFRYIYFAIFLVAILISLVLSYIYKHYKIITILVLAFMIIYPSNIFFPHGALTAIKPEAFQVGFSNEPVIDYSLNESTKSLIANSKILALWTPGVAWYFKNPDYAIPFSLDGTTNGFAFTDGKDIYTGAKEFTFNETNFVYLEDYFGYSKLTSDYRNKLDAMKFSCNLIEQTNSIKVYTCAF